ncbi:MAG: hypothetical protein GXP46_01710 [Deferribacteres bacterium]|nr:hypothetical protein [Deferribacteres bacterium]
MQKQKICKVEGCGNPFKARGYCDKHYKNAVKTGEIKTTPRNKKKINPQPEKQETCNAENMTAMLAQLLYCSRVLDSEINAAMLQNRIEIKNISDVRFRLGEIMRGAL